MGPGKADLLEAIAETGSISAAARQTGMSYRRAWLLMDAMNRSFEQPLVDTATGGKGGGGARITDFGKEVLRRNRSMESLAAETIESQAAEFLKLISKVS
ncbi:MAG: LysR family transcriptional regulator [Burkholderiales bacterium]|nr:LysR family transcriptional regulator [Burkholderiales bacterium]